MFFGSSRKMMLVFTIVLALLYAAVANGNCRVSDFKGVWAISDNGRFNLDTVLEPTLTIPPANVALLVGRLSFDAKGNVQNPSWIKTADLGVLASFTSIKGNLTTTSSCQVIIKLTLVNNDGSNATKYLQYEGYVQAGKQVLEMYSTSSYRITRAQLSKAPNRCGKLLPFTALVGSDIFLAQQDLIPFAFQLTCTVPKTSTCEFTSGQGASSLPPGTPLQISYSLSSNCLFHTSGPTNFIGSVHKFGMYYLSTQDIGGLSVLSRAVSGQV